MATSKNVTTIKQETAISTLLEEAELIKVLTSSLYPGASHESVKLVLGYCTAAQLDPMQKPVHIVPMWDKNSGQMRDVIMPGIGLYRTQAARSGNYAGVTEPEYGPDKTEKIGGVDITYPEWCKVTVKRVVSGGAIAEFTAVERWKENYAVKGGKEKSIAPNAMWLRRPYGQIAKCAEAQALRKAFPEFGAQPTAEEMDGAVFDPIDVTPTETIQQPKPKPLAKTEPIPGQLVDAEDIEPTPEPGSVTLCLNEGQQRMIRKRLEITGMTEAELLGALGFQSIELIPAASANAALKMINNYGANDANV